MIVNFTYYYYYFYHHYYYYYYWNDYYYYYYYYLQLLMLLLTIIRHFTTPNAPLLLAGFSTASITALKNCNEWIPTWNLFYNLPGVGRVWQNVEYFLATRIRWLNNLWQKHEHFTSCHLAKLGNDFLSV